MGVKTLWIFNFIGIIITLELIVAFIMNWILMVFIGLVCGIIYFQTKQILEWKCRC